MNRDSDLVRARQEFLRTGTVGIKYSFTRGVRSILCDPWVLMATHMPGPLGFKLRQIRFKRAAGAVGRGVLIDPNVHIPILANLYLDDFCYLGWGLNLYAPEGYVRIGKRSHVTGWILGHEGVEIGDYVACGGTLLSISDTHRGGCRISGPMIPDEQRNLRRGKVVVQKDAFVGHFSIVMPGVTIGEGAVVAPHSLVVADVPPWTVVSGSPAVKISVREPVRFEDPD